MSRVIHYNVPNLPTTKTDAWAIDLMRRESAAFPGNDSLLIYCFITRLMNRRKLIVICQLEIVLENI